MQDISLPRVGIIGVGAIGCTLAARFAHAGCHVKVAATPTTAAIMRRDGIHLSTIGMNITAPVTVIHTPEELLDRDYIFISVKQYDLISAVRYWLPILTPSMTVIPAINGVPWWFLKTGSEAGLSSNHFVNAELESLLPRSHILGTAIHITAYSSSPGTAVQGSKNRLIIGELDGARSSRLVRLQQASVAAGMECDISESIRLDVWMKIVGNAVFNPISVLSGADMACMLADHDISKLALSMIHELFVLGRRLGLRIDISPEERFRRSESAGNAQTSMLQDYLKGKPLEVEGIIGTVVRLGHQYELDMPFTTAVYGLVRNAALNNPFLQQATRRWGQQHEAL